MKDLNGSNAHNASAPGTSYDTQNMTHRSAKAEWQPHRAQTTMSCEWCYMTAISHDPLVTNTCSMIRFSNSLTRMFEMTT